MMTTVRLTDEEREQLFSVLYPTSDTKAIRGRVVPVMEALIQRRLEGGRLMNTPNALAAGRHPKWVRVEPGTVIPAGQPYRVEHGGGTAYEGVANGEGFIVGNVVSVPYFVDPSWKPPHPCNAPLNIKGEGFNCDREWGHALPHGNTEAGAIWDGEQPPNDSPEPTPEPPLVLPTEPTWGIAVHRFFEQIGWAADLWHKDPGDGTFLSDEHRWAAADVVDFIPLTDEQVQRIEAAR